MPERLSCFIMMPYSESSDDLYRQAILPAILSVPGPGILALRADEMGRQEITVKAHVESAVRSADFCIVDITGGNPNVMYELGYASAKNKPLIILQEEGQGKPPANLMHVPLLRYSRRDLHVFSYKLNLAIRSLVETIPQESTGTFGENAPLVQLDSSILNNLSKSVRRRLSALVGSPHLLVEHIVPALKLSSPRTGMSIRIVCTDPEGEFVRARSLDLGRSVSLYRAELWSSLGRLQELLRSIEEVESEVRLTNRPIGNSIYIFDNVALIVPHLLSARSRESTGIISTQDRDPRSFNAFEQEFGRTWSEATMSEPSRFHGRISDL